MESITNQIEQNLTKHLNKYLTKDPFSEIYTYAVIPPGKLFRPLLAVNLASDLGQEITILDSKSDLAFFCSFLETHHAYTLIHDDLPSMDNDDYRRGKLTVHKKYNEWSAILAGDGLLNLSYHLLSQMKSSNMPAILKFSSWALGPKGLIQGQAIDMMATLAKDFQAVLCTHEYKTARLIQTALVGSLLLSKPNASSQLIKEIWKLGLYLGISFQLIDDLTELAEENLSSHEKEISPWLNFPNKSLMHLTKQLTLMKQILSKNQLNNTSEMIQRYLNKMRTTIINGQHNIDRHIKITDFSRPIIDLLN